MENAPQKKMPERRIIYCARIFNKTFLQNNLVVSIKLLTLHADTGNDGETTETNAAKCIHAHGHNRNEMRANLLFDFLDKLLTSVKK